MAIEEVIEPDFIQAIHTELSQPGTCAVGYNSNSFDASVTRNSLYRNLHCPYEGLYNNGQSQWDILNLARACFALRPEGIQWPVLEDRPSLRLEDLAFANDIDHSAHDALSDVKATIELAKLINDNNPSYGRGFLHTVQGQDLPMRARTLASPCFISLCGQCVILHHCLLHR